MSSRSDCVQIVMLEIESHWGILIACVQIVMLENSNTDSHVLMLVIEEYCLVDFWTQNGYIRFPVASLNAIFMELTSEMHLNSCKTLIYPVLTPNMLNGITDLIKNGLRYEHFRPLIRLKDYITWTHPPTASALNIT